MPPRWRRKRSGSRCWSRSCGGSRTTPGHNSRSLKATCRVFDLLQVAATNPMSSAEHPGRGHPIPVALSHAPSPGRVDAAGVRGALPAPASGLVALATGVGLVPVQGKGYLYLAELAFLDGAGDSCKKACIQQALRVRPHDAYVHYTAANEAWMAGDPAGWLDYARQAFQGDIAFEAAIDRRLDRSHAAGGDRADGRVHHQGISTRPGRLVVSVGGSASSVPRPNSCFSLRRHYAQAAESEARPARGDTAAHAWLLASRLYVELGDGRPGVASARAAPRRRFPARSRRGASWPCGW